MPVLVGEHGKTSLLNENVKGEQGKIITIYFSWLLIDSTGSDNMYPVDFIFGIQGNDAEFLNRFGFEIEDELEGSITSQRAGYPAAFEVIAAAFGEDLFEGVDIDIGKRHKNNSHDIRCFVSVW